MDTVPLASSLNRRKPLICLLLLLLVQIGGCESKKEPKQEAREEAIKEEKKETKREERVLIGMVTTTNYCKGIITSADVKVEPGYIALSHDIKKRHRLKFGDLIYLEGETEPYVFMDSMPPKWKRRADLYNKGCKPARKYGVQRRRLWFVRKH
jgi:hypothetical protein